MSSHPVFLTWNDSRRSMSLSARLGLDRVVIVGNRRGFTRHVLGTFATIIFLVRKRPELVWFQFSLALAVILWLYSSLRPRTRVQLVADIHTKAMRRSGPIGARRIVRLLKRRALRRCLAVLVTNRENARYTEEFLGAHALVLPDPLPRVPALAQLTSHASRPDIAFICSFAEDEPISLMIEVASQLRGNAQIVFTGDASGLRPSVRQEIQRVARFTGFLPDEDYWQLIRSTPCIVVLSDEPACLPCGAYESIAVGRRPILVDDAHARELFGDLAIYVHLRPQALVSAIRTMLSHRLEPREPNVAGVYESRWQEYWQHIERRLAGRALRRFAVGN